MRKKLLSGNGISIWWLPMGERWQCIDSFGVHLGGPHTSDKYQYVIDGGIERYGKGKRTYYTADGPCAVIRYSDDDQPEKNEFGEVCP